MPRPLNEPVIHRARPDALMPILSTILSSHRRTLADTNAGAAARLAIQAIKLSGWALTPFRHRYFWHICKYAGRLVNDSAVYCTMRIGAESFYRFNLDDPYWSMLLCGQFFYERELQVTLARTREIDFAVVDCGANFGYWSVLASSPEAGRHPVVAVEASVETFAALTCNWRLNQSRFAIINAAVSSASGDEAQVARGRGHAGAHIGTPEPGERAVGTVRTITIDDAIVSTFGSMPPRLLLKLDVEGAEIAALQGAKSALRQDCLICYEDHGRDKTSVASRYVLETLKQPIYYVEPTDGTVVAIDTLADVDRIKARKVTGTNFFTCSSDSEFRGAFTRDR
jgi:FkbM family methyltransferase